MWKLYSLSHFFVKATVLLKKLLNSWFDEFFFSEMRENFQFFHSVEKRKHSLSPKTFFRQINSSVTYFRDIFAKNGWDRIPVFSTMCFPHNFIIFFSWIRSICIIRFYDFFVKLNLEQVAKHNFVNFSVNRTWHSVEIAEILSHTFYLSHDCWIIISKLWQNTLTTTYLANDRCWIPVWTFSIISSQHLSQN